MKGGDVSKSKPSEYLPAAEEALESVSRQLPEIDNADTLLADEGVTLPEELVAGVLHQGLKAVIGGSSKAAKTWTMLDLAAAVASGMSWLGHKCREGKVLYVNFEIPRAFVRKRLQALQSNKQISSLANLDMWTLRGHAADLETLVATIVEAARLGGYVLIVIDPIYKCYGGRDENKASDIALLCNEMERIAVQTGAALLYAAHYSKGNQAGKETLDRISGSGVFTRDADTIINFTKHSAENCYTVEMVLRNLPQPEPFVVEWKYPVMVLRPELDPTALKESKPKNRALEVTA
jgi:RecA-family ATPase